MWISAISGLLGALVGGFLVAFFAGQREKFVLTEKWMASLRSELGEFIGSAARLNALKARCTGGSLAHYQQVVSTYSEIPTDKEEEYLSNHADCLSKMNRVLLLLRQKRPTSGAISAAERYENELEASMKEYFRHIDNIYPLAQRKDFSETESNVIRAARQLLFINWQRVKNGVTVQGSLLELERYLNSH